MPARADDDCATVLRLFSHPNQERFAVCVTVMTNFRNMIIRMITEMMPFDVVQTVASHEARLLRYSLQETDAALLQLPDLPDTLLD